MEQKYRRELVETGLKIRARRKELEIKQGELATRLGISPSHLSEFEHGASCISLATFIGIAYELTLDPSRLLNLDLPYEGSVAPELASLPGNFTTREMDFICDYVRGLKCIIRDAKNIFGN